MPAIPCNRRRIENPDSDCPVWKLSDWDDCHCVLGYLTFKSFSHDGRYLFFASDRTGAFQLYRLDLVRQEAAQITGPGGAVDAQGVPTEGRWRDVNVHPCRPEFTYCTDRALYIAGVESLEQRILAECPAEWKRFDATPQFSADGKRLATVYELPDGRRGVAVGEVGDQPSRLESVLLGKPGDHIGYLIIAPVKDRFILSVCYGGPDRQNDPAASRELRARAWRLDADSRDFRPYLVMPPGFRATHQFYGPGGRLYFHRKTVGTWTPAWVASIDIDGNDYREHLRSADRKLGHGCISPNGNWLISDVQEPGRNELIHVPLTGGGEPQILFWPNASNGPRNEQETHVHPSADFQGHYVAFQSDRDGKCGLYMLEVE